MQKYQESNFSFIFCFLTRSKYVTHLVSPQSTVLDDSIGCALWFAARGQGILTCSQCIEDIKEPSMSCGCRPSYTCPAKVCAAYFRMVKQISLGCQTVLICVMTHSFYTAKLKTPQTCCKLSILPTFCNLSTSCNKLVNFIKLQQAY